jgi:group II intron reverse transcriptase/maturase
MIFKEEQKTQPIERSEVWEAFKRVKAGGKSPGVDGVTIDAVAGNPRKYLYPVWNRLASGSYYPPAVRQAEIPKGDGTKRVLGIPTVTDRVAQMVIKQKLEKLVDKHFSANSFGYRPNLSAHDAIERCRINCLRYSWVIDLDIKGFFDNIDHDLMMLAVKRFTSEKCILMYVERWLKAPVILLDGTLKESNGRGTPQGGVISPLLANIFLHFAFDLWMRKYFPDNVFERYADDIIIHCNRFKEANRVLKAVGKRLEECKLSLHPTKTKIVYCYNNQKRQVPMKLVNKSFDFLGYTFKPRIVKARGVLCIGFSPGISKKSQKRINEVFFKLKIHRWTHLTIDQIAEFLRAQTRGWINYFGKFRKTEMRNLFRCLNFRLAHWVRNRYRRFWKRPRSYAYNWLVKVSKAFPSLFVHWEHSFLP